MAKAVAEDLGIKPWWNPPDLRRLYLGLRDFEYQRMLMRSMRCFNPPIKV